VWWSVSFGVLACPLSLSLGEGGLGRSRVPQSCVLTEFFVSLRPSTPRFLPQTTHLRERCAPICFFMIGGLWVGARRVCCGVRASMGAGMAVAVAM
jgi:hypothetical protein